MKNLTETEKAYIAGILDGEGCIGIDKIKSRSNIHPFDFKIRIIVTNTNENIICWLKTVVGAGCAYVDGKPFSEKWNVVHRWQIVSEQARDFLMQVYPYLRIKKDIADLVLELPKLKTQTKYYGRSQQEYESQFQIYSLAKARNTRGVKK